MVADTVFENIFPQMYFYENIK